MQFDSLILAFNASSMCIWVCMWYEFVAVITKLIVGKWRNLIFLLLNRLRLNEAQFVFENFMKTTPFTITQKHENEPL